MLLNHVFFVRNERIIQDGLQYYNASKLRSFSIYLDVYSSQNTNTCVHVIVQSMAIFFMYYSHRAMKSETEAKTCRL